MYSNCPCTSCQWYPPGPTTPGLHNNSTSRYSSSGVRRLLECCQVHPRAIRLTITTPALHVHQPIGSGGTCRPLFSQVFCQRDDYFFRSKELEGLFFFASVAVTVGEKNQGIVILKQWKVLKGSFFELGTNIAALKNNMFFLFYQNEPCRMVVDFCS